MRCSNCGWMNPDHLSRCQKCNQEIKPDAFSAPQANRVEKPLGVGTLAFDEVTCSRCGYPYQKGNNVCPNCGTPAIAEQPVFMDPKKTQIIENPQYASGQPMQNFNSNPASQPAAVPTPANVNREFAATRIDCSPRPKVHTPANVGMNATVALNSDADRMAANNSFSNNNNNFNNNNSSSDNFKYKKTIKDVSSLEQGYYIGEVKKEQPIANTNCYKLHTMDVTEENKYEISITSPFALDLKSGDVILVGGQRFKML